MTDKAQTPGVALVISAPSGGGKSTIIAEARKHDSNLAFSVSCTTRSPRPGEEEGVHYHFLTRDEFQAKIDAGEFLEHAEFSGNLYGTLRSEVEERIASGRDVIIEIEVQGAAQVREAAKHGILADCVFFMFVAPPSMEVLEQRLRGRGTETEEAIQRRLSAAKMEMAQRDLYDVVIINDTLEQAVTDFRNAINRKREELANG